jgi:hypothetical protein
MVRMEDRAVMTTPEDVELTFKRVALERLDVATQRTIQIGNGARFDVRPDIFQVEADRMIAELRSYIWTEVIQDETVTLDVTFSYPATWWQHFKQRWLVAATVCKVSFVRAIADRMLHRWPVVVQTVGKKQTHRFKTVALLPEFKYESPPGCGAHVMRTTLDGK